MEEYDFEDREVDDVVRSYNAIKGWRTKEVNRLENLVNLQRAKYSSLFEREMFEQLTKLERHVDLLQQIAAWLKDQGIEDPDSYVNEAKAWAGGQAQANNVVQRAGTINPKNDLRPKCLNEEYTFAQVREWKAEYTAYYESSDMRLLQNKSAQAYLMQCVEGNLKLRLREEISDTTPVLPANSQL